MRRFSMVLIGSLLLVGCGSASSDQPSSQTQQSTPSTTPPGADTAATTAPVSPEPPEPTATATSSTTSVTVPGPGEPTPPEELVVVAYPVPAGSRPHDVAPAHDGGVWYTAQNAGALGWLDPDTGETRHIPLGSGSRPHGVIVDKAGDAWVTDGGLNAIVRVGATTDEVTVFPLPENRPNANLNTASFGPDGRLWFTGQNGIHGVLDPSSGEMTVYDSPRGTGPYGIHTSGDGNVFFASLAGSYVGVIEQSDGSVIELDPPTPDQGARRVWFDSAGRAWVSEWNSGQLSVYDPADGSWATHPLPGEAPSAYAVYVDEADIVWVSDFGGNAIHRFDPTTATFFTFDLPGRPSNVRQLLGRPGEVWGAESAADALVVIRRP